MQSRSNEVEIDVRHVNKIVRLRFKDGASTENFRALCRLFAEESRLAFGSGTAYWLLNDGKAVDGPHDVPTQILDGMELMEMVVFLMRHRVGPYSIAEAHEQEICSYSYHNGDLTFGALRLPERRPFAKGQLIQVLLKAGLVDGVLVGIEGDDALYVSASTVKEDGHVDKNATIHRIDLRRVYHSSRHQSAVLDQEKIRSRGDFLLRPILYGQTVEISTWFPPNAIFRHLEHDGKGSGVQRRIVATFRGLLETDDGMMFECDGAIADLFWGKEISSLKLLP
jgi:hypothetical protein